MNLRPGNVLVAVRNPHSLEHLKKTLGNDGFVLEQGDIDDIDDDFPIS